MPPGFLDFGLRVPAADFLLETSESECDVAGEFVQQVPALIVELIVEMVDSPSRSSGKEAEERIENSRILPCQTVMRWSSSARVPPKPGME